MALVILVGRRPGLIRANDPLGRPTRRWYAEEPVVVTEDTWDRIVAHQRCGVGGRVAAFVAWDPTGAATLGVKATGQPIPGEEIVVWTWVDRLVRAPVWRLVAWNRRRRL